MCSTVRAVSDVVTAAIVEITLLETKPPIRRRVSVPYSIALSRFHLVLQVAMGWEQREAHAFVCDEFTAGNPKEIDDWDIENESRVRLDELLPWIGAKAIYLYDFRDEWQHSVRLVELEPGTGAITLVSGNGACPPEGSGGPKKFQRKRNAAGAKRGRVSGGSGRLNTTAINEELVRLSNRWRRRRIVPNSSRELVLSDGKAIRAGYLEGLKSLRQRLLAIEDELARHESQDLPEFRRFISAAFGVHFSSLRELQQQIDWLSARLALVQKLMQHGVRPVGRAYLRALRIEAGDEPYPEFPPERVEPQPSKEERAGMFDRDTVRDFISAMGDQLLTDEEMETLTQDVLDAKDTSYRNAVAECKTLYRKIVTLLHPDRAGEMTEETKELWLRTQSAYADSDVLTLKSILDRCDTGGVERYLTCSEIIEATVESALQLEAIQMLRVRVAKEPSWNFCRLSEKQRKARLRRVTADLEEERNELGNQLRELQRECAHLDQLARRWELKRVDDVYQPDLFS